MENRTPILIADDDHSIRRVTSGILSAFGYNVETAKDGEAALTALRARRYCLLLTDHEMPKLSGLQLVRLTRSWITALPVIVVSGGLSAEDFERYMALGVSSILPKPFSSTQLLDAVNSILRCADKSPTRLHSFAPQSENDNGARNENGAFLNIDTKGGMVRWNNILSAT